MKPDNGYISAERVLSLIQRGWVFRQDLMQTAFKVAKSDNSCDYYKLNKKTASQVKNKINQLKSQIHLL